MCPEDLAEIRELLRQVQVGRRHQHREPGDVRIGADRDRTQLGAWWIYALLILGIILLVGPFIWMLLGSFKPNAEFLRTPPTWLPGGTPSEARTPPTTSHGSSPPTRSSRTFRDRLRRAAPLRV